MNGFDDKKDKRDIELAFKGEGNIVASSSVITRSEMRTERQGGGGNNGGLLRLDRVAVRTPISGRELWSNLSMTLSEGDSVLVIGPSGCGKSSLLRAVAGVWTSGQCEIIAPPHDDTLFLPQSPYMPLGSMRAQLLFPASAGESEDTARDIGGSGGSGGEGDDNHHNVYRSFDDEALLSALDAAGLGELPDRFAHEGGLNAVVEWADVLSAGEQQRVAFARLFLRRPVCAFLDEATSALDERGEAAMYSLLKRHVRGVVSVGHRSTLMKYHSHVLRFVPAAEGVEDGGGDDIDGVSGGGGSWVLERMEEYRRSANGALHMF